MGIPDTRKDWTVKDGISSSQANLAQRNQLALDFDPSPAYTASLSPISGHSMLTGFSNVSHSKGRPQTASPQGEEYRLAPLYQSSLSRFESFLKQEQSIHSRFGTERAMQELESFFQEELMRRRKDYSASVVIHTSSDTSSVSELSYVQSPASRQLNSGEPSSARHRSQRVLPPSYELAAVLVGIPQDLNCSSTVSSSLERTRAMRSSFLIDLHQIRQDLSHLYLPMSSPVLSPSSSFGSRASIRDTISAREHGSIGLSRPSGSSWQIQGDEVYRTFTDKTDQTIQAIYAEYGLVQGILAQKEDLLDVHHASSALEEIAMVAEEVIHALATLEDEKVQHRMAGSKRNKYIAQKKQAACRAQEKVVRTSPLVEALAMTISYYLHHIDLKVAPLREQIQVVANEVNVAQRQSGPSGPAAFPGQELLEQLEHAVRMYELLLSRHSLLSEDLRRAREKLRKAEHDALTAEISLVELQEGRFDDVQNCPAMKTALKRERKGTQAEYTELLQEREKRQRIKDNALGPVIDIISRYQNRNGDYRANSVDSHSSAVWSYG